MLLACNYSKELVELLNEGAVEIDYIKLGLFHIYKDVLEEARSLKPVLLHGLGYNERTGMKNIEDVDWKYVNNSISKFQSPHYGIHLLSSIQDWSSLCTDREIVDHMINIVEIWKDNIQVPFLVENMPYSLFDKEKFGVMKFCSNTEIINEICEKTNVNLLLDIAHAKVAATNSGENVYDYLNRLPLHRVKEIHVVGTKEVENVELRDWHLEMNDEDYELLQWILSKTSPYIVTLEYGGPGELYSWRSDKEVLRRQLIRLMDICREN